MADSGKLISSRNMKQCDICGNEIDDIATSCPFCHSPQEPLQTIKKKTVKRVLVLNIKKNNPTVDEAMQQLATEISTARKRHIKVMKIIHGYGSTGAGGVIKPALLSKLRSLKNDGNIKMYITGEEHNEYAGGRNYLLNKYPELKETWKEDRGNRGITFIEI